jgi:hypothetical protein
MVTHDPRIAAYADRIVFLKDGKVIDETQLERTSPDAARRGQDKRANAGGARGNSKTVDLVTKKVKELGK